MIILIVYQLRPLCESGLSRATSYVGPHPVGPRLRWSSYYRVRAAVCCQFGPFRLVRFRFGFVSSRLPSNRFASFRSISFRFAFVVFFVPFPFCFVLLRCVSIRSGPSRSVSSRFVFASIFSVSFRSVLLRLVPFRETPVGYTMDCCCCCCSCCTTGRPQLGSLGWSRTRSSWLLTWRARQT